IPIGETPFKCAPPIREAANREALWLALGEGVLDLVASDHSPCTPGLKRLDAGDFVAAWGGVSGLQLSLPVMWTEASQRGHALAALVGWMCAGPARLARLDHKGAIAVGNDADLVVFDEDGRTSVTAEAIHHRHKATPYDGEVLRGAIEATYLRGHK